MNLFVTGGTGFFGKALLRYWQKNKPQFKKIYLLSRSPDTFLENYSDLVKGLPIELVKGDILNLSEVNIDQDLNIILHAATDSTIGPTMGRLDVYHQITHGSEEVLKFATSHNCQKFVLTSSGGVYGIQPSSLAKISEDYLGMPDSLNPNSAYGIGKRSAEHITALYAKKYNFDFVVARCFAFVGEDLPLDAHFAIGNFLNSAINGQDIIINGDGSPLRSYMYQEDLARVLTNLMLNDYKYNVFNVGSDYAISIKDLAYLVKKLIPGSGTVKIMSKNDGNKKNIYVPSIKRLMEVFPSENFLSLENAILESFHQLEKH